MRPDQCLGAAYTASKHALIGLTKNTSTFYFKKGIRCNAVLPGGMQTNVFSAFANGVHEEGMSILKGDSGEFSYGTVELEKVASAVLFLSSEGASAISGVCMPIDNGWANK